MAFLLMFNVCFVNVRLCMQYMSVMVVSLCCLFVCLFVNDRTLLMLRHQPTRDVMLL